MKIFLHISSILHFTLYILKRPVRLREKTGLPKIAAKRDSWERGAAGAAGEAASTAHRLPWRLAGDEMRGYRPCYRQSRQNKDESTLIRHAQQAARATFPLKKGEGMKWESVCNRCACAQDFSTRSVAAAPSLGRNDKEGIILRDPFDCAALAMPPPLRSG